MARTRYQHMFPADLPFSRLPGAALRAVLADGYSAAELRADVMAGLVVGMVALPLAMALAIAVGVPPQHGLDTAIVAGFLVAALGGSRTQVTGPTAAFIVILAPIHAKFGFAGLLVSGLMGGLIMVAMGLLRVGKLIEFVPHPVTTGFTAGIATVIATFQLKDLLGLALASQPDHYFERLLAMWHARATFSPGELLLGAGTLALLVALPRFTRRVPPPLVALPAAAVVAALLPKILDGFHPATIASRFHSTVAGVVVHGIPQLPPLPSLPWSAPGPGGAPFLLDFHSIHLLLPGAFAIAMLGAIESLLSAVVADGMAHTRHDPDAELIALGIGNIAAPFFGGIPATGAIARTATNIRSGARSPIAAMVHALTILASVLLLAPLLGYLPMSALAALLVLVAWNMCELKHFVHTLRVAPRADVAVLLTCYGLTVAFDMVISVSVGMVLASFLFMKRMSEVTHARLLVDHHPAWPRRLPSGVVIYDISGPLFFGAAHKAMAALGELADTSRAVILSMEEVHAMDVTGLVALESAIGQLLQRGTLAILIGVRQQPLALLEKARLFDREGVMLCADLEEALLLAAGWQPG